MQIYNDLCRDGIHHSAAFNVGVSASKMAATLNLFGPSCIDFVEPQNEYDNRRNPDWATDIFDEQTTLYHLIKSTPAFRNIVVLGPALSSIARFGLLKNLDNIEDAANLHDASCDGNPGTHYYGSLARHISRVRLATKIRPIWVTEAAYGDATLDSGLPQANHCGLPDSVIARYVPRSQAERFNLGEQRIYWYEFSDQPRDKTGAGAEGFVDQNGMPKPQYFAVQSLIKLLADPGHPFTPRQPTLNVSSGSAAVHTLLLQKHDGSYYLMLWQEVPSWDVKGHVVLSPPPVDVRLSMSPTVNSADYYQYDSGWRFVQKPVQVHNGIVTVPITDSISVLRFTPAG
ncbi:MAG: hypothetical protein GIX03_01425 [Candidatus Eremiobacteraeota bacterium]|nr:hypothetical protein [Candidatus Eremiobacteraeota bacterium]MBC5801680.1 hypothetical protein [Candidatus Eremiobacteraeota bacterium]MBC5824038.1 hypothetical protein [Candidatus Eremiobacteraeota bacterium]